MTLLIGSCVAPVTIPNNHSSGPEIVSVVVQNNPRQWPPTYYTDPYTGETYQTRPGYIDPRGNITITLKNRPFTAYIDKNGNTINIYYAVFFKGEGSRGGWTSEPYCVYQSDSIYTDMTFLYGVVGSMSSTHVGTYNDGGLVDFRVQTVMGYFIESYEVSGIESGLGYSYWVPAVYEGEGSAFTEFTIAIPSSSDASGTSRPDIQSPSNSPSTTPTGSPQNSQQHSFMIILVCFVCVVAVLFGVVVYLFRQRKVGSFNDAVRFWEVTNTCQ